MLLSACGGKEAPVRPPPEAVAQSGQTAGSVFTSGSDVASTGDSSGTANPSAAGNSSDIVILASSGDSSGAVTSGSTGESSGVVISGGAGAWPAGIPSCTPPVVSTGVLVYGPVTPKVIPGKNLVVLASGQTAPYYLAIDATHVYWSTYGSIPQHDGTIMRVPIGGGTPTELASGQAAPGGIAVDATNVYWATGGVMTVPKGGGAPIMLAPGLTDDNIAVGPTGVYGTGYGPTQGDALMRVPLDGGGPFQLDVPAFNNTYGIALDAHYAYWSNFGGSAPIRRVPLLGGQETTLATGQAAFGIAVDDKYVYWANAGDGTIRSVPVGGGTTKILVSGVSGANQIAVDGASIYMTTRGPRDCGMVIKAPIGGGAPTALVTGLAQPWGIAVDATSVYWTNVVELEAKGAGSVMQLTPK